MTVVSQCFMRCFGVKNAYVSEAVWLTLLKPDENAAHLHCFLP